MADTKIEDLTDGTTANATDRLPVTRDPNGTPVNRYITPGYIRTYILGLANTFTATQTITPAANTNALAVTGYSLTGSNAQSLLDLAGTWNTTGTPTAIKLNVTDTASNAASMLAELQIGGVRRFGVRKDGYIYAGNGSLAAVSFFAGDAEIWQAYGTGFGVQPIRIAASGGLAFGTGGDVVLIRDAAGTLAQRLGTNAQTFRVYGTWTNASNGRWLDIAVSTGGVVTLQATGNGTGASGNVLHISSLPTSNPGPGILWNNAGTPAIGT